MEPITWVLFGAILVMALALLVLASKVGNVLTGMDTLNDAFKGTHDRTDELRKDSFATDQGLEGLGLESQKVEPLIFGKVRRSIR